MATRFLKKKIHRQQGSGKARKPSNFYRASSSWSKIPRKPGLVDCGNPLASCQAQTPCKDLADEKSCSLRFENTNAAFFLSAYLEAHRVFRKTELLHCVILPRGRPSGTVRGQCKFIFPDGIPPAGQWKLSSATEQVYRFYRCTFQRQNNNGPFDGNPARCSAPVYEFYPRHFRPNNVGYFGGKEWTHRFPPASRCRPSTPSSANRVNGCTMPVGVPVEKRGKRRGCSALCEI